MSRSKVKLWCLLEGETKPFSVPHNVEGDVDDLVKAVKEQNRLLSKFNTSDVVLWKLKNFIQIDSDSPLSLVERLPFPFRLADFAVKLDKCTQKFSDVFPRPLAEGHLHIIVQRPDITASLSIDSNLSAGNLLKRPHSPDYLTGSKRLRTNVKPQDIWIEELHSKIWGRKDLQEQLFHNVEITEAHYETLQTHLLDLESKSNSQSLGPACILSTKLKVLLSPSAPGRAVHPDKEQIETENDEGSDAELRSIFPAKVEFLDLSSLELQNMPPRMPLPLLVRQEYKAITQILNCLPKDGGGSAIISGQPGTGKTTYLNLRVVGSMIVGCPFLYQTIDGTVYHVSNVITRVESWASPTPVEAFIDGDSKFEPQSFIYYNPHVRIVMASSPKGADQKWLKQLPPGSFVHKYVAGLWSFNELFLTGIFLNPQRLTYERIKESTCYFGFNPRQCFSASVAPSRLLQLTSEIKAKIRDISSKEDLQHLLNASRTSSGVPHMVFELSPADDLRLFCQAQVGAVSRWALNILLEAYEERRADAVHKFFNSLATISSAQSIRGLMFERQVLRYLDTLEGPHCFTIRSLEDSTTSEWKYPGPAKRLFQQSTFSQSLQIAVDGQIPLHLVPEDPNFPAADSISYSPDEGLRLNQVIISYTHPIAVSGFKRVQVGLKLNTLLSGLRPSTQPGRHWRLTFFVPESMADTFTKQSFIGDTVTKEWARKVDQYVLSIEDNTLWGRATKA